MPLVHPRYVCAVIPFSARPCKRGVNAANLIIAATCCSCAQLSPRLHWHFSFSYWSIHSIRYGCIQLNMVELCGRQSVTVDSAGLQRRASAQSQRAGACDTINHIIIACICSLYSRAYALATRLSQRYASPCSGEALTLPRLRLRQSFSRTHFVHSI